MQRELQRRHPTYVYMHTHLVGRSFLQRHDLLLAIDEPHVHGAVPVLVPVHQPAWFHLTRRHTFHGEDVKTRRGGGCITSNISDADCASVSAFGFFMRYVFSLLVKYMCRVTVCTRPNRGGGWCFQV